MGKEILFFSTLFRQRRYLWPFSLSLHLGIYLLVVSLLILSSGLLATRFGLCQKDCLSGAVSFSSSAGHIFGFCGSSVLLCLRLFHPDLRPFSSNSKYLSLSLLACLFGTGLYGYLSTDLYGAYRSYMEYLFGMREGLELAIQGYIHLIATLVFIVWLPLSDMVHFVAKYFTYHRIRWDRKSIDTSMERRLRRLRSQRISWASLEEARPRWSDL
jgi:nitrate reductase gamma subunit